VGFQVTHRFGGDDPDPPVSALGSLLDEVDEDPTDKGHVGGSVVHESGWAIGLYPGWSVILENVEELDIKPRHVDIGHDRDEALRLMRAAAVGDLSTLTASGRRRAVLGRAGRQACAVRAGAERLRTTLSALPSTS
jgi:hypothetical protein